MTVAPLKSRQKVEELVALHDELDELEAKRDSVGPSIVLVFAAFLLVTLGVDRGSLFLALSGLLAGAGGGWFVSREIRRSLRKRSLRRLLHRSGDD